MRLKLPVILAMMISDVSTPCAAQTQHENVSDSVAVVIRLQSVQAPFSVQPSGALLAVRAALHRLGIAVVRSSPRVMTVSLSAHVVPSIPNLFPEYLEPLLEEVEWRVDVSHSATGSGEIPTRRQTQGRSFIGTWAAEATTGIRTAVLSAVRAHAQRVNLERATSTTSQSSPVQPLCLRLSL